MVPSFSLRQRSNGAGLSLAGGGSDGGTGLKSGETVGGAGGGTGFSSISCRFETGPSHVAEKVTVRFFSMVSTFSIEVTMVPSFSLRQVAQRSNGAGLSSARGGSFGGMGLKSGEADGGAGLQTGGGTGFSSISCRFETGPSHVAEKVTVRFFSMVSTFSIEVMMVPRFSLR